jgi:glyoxylase-like metal-dependent hydrolase (beta-lactamase superfamily II)
MEIRTFISKTMGENCYAITIGGEIAIIDPGECSAELLEFVQKSGSSIKYIFLTHCHFDHIMGVEKIVEICPNAQIIAFESEKEGLFSPSINLGILFGIPTLKVKPDLTVKDQDIIILGGEEIKVIHTPGHTKGSCCFLYDDILFSGDTLFKESYGRTDLPGGSETELKNSLKRLFGLEAKTVVYSGHGATTTIGNEIVKNPIKYL